MHVKQIEKEINKNKYIFDEGFSELYKKSFKKK
jgi:hypothetical protein